MASTVLPQVYGNLKTTLYRDAALSNVAQLNITGGAGKLHTIRANNAHGTHGAHLYLYDTDQVTVGTTLVDWCMYIPPNNKNLVFTLTDTDGAGVAFTSLSVCAVKDVSSSNGPGGTGSTVPTGNVLVEIVTTQSS